MATHELMKVRHLSLPSSLLSQSSSSTVTLSYGSALSSGKISMVCSKISSSSLRDVVYVRRAATGYGGGFAYFVRRSSRGETFSRRFQYVYWSLPSEASSALTRRRNTPEHVRQLSQRTLKTDDVSRIISDVGDMNILLLNLDTMASVRRVDLHENLQHTSTAFWAVFGSNLPAIVDV